MNEPYRDEEQFRGSGVQAFREEVRKQRSDWHSGERREDRGERFSLILINTVIN